MKRKILILFIVIGIAAEIIFVSSKLLGASKNKNVIAEKIEEKIGARTEIKGKVELKLFPIPKFVISHLRLYDLKYKNSSYNVRASLFEARVPILSILTGDINIKEISIENAKIEHIKILGNSDTAKHVDLINLPYKKIKLVESALILNSNRELTTKFDNLNLELENLHHSIKISSKFSSGINNYSVESYVAKKNKADLDIDLSVNFTGGSLDLTASYDAKLKKYKGDTSISGANIQEFFFNNFMSTWFLFPDNRKFSYNSSFSFAKQDGKLSIKDGEISGEAIKGEFSGLLEDKKRGFLSFNVDYLNLDALFSTHKQSYIREEMAFMNLENKYSFFNSSENVSISGLFNKVIYKDKEVGPLNLDMSLNEESNMQIDSLSFELEGGVHNSISGVFKHNMEGYKFEGNVTSKGDDIKSVVELISDSKFVRQEGGERSAYELSAELILSDSVLDLRNINAIIGLGEVKGEVHYNILEQSKSKIFLDAKALDFNEFLVSKGKNDVRHLIHLLYDKLAIRESGISLLQNFLWLRNIFNEINFELNLKEAIFNDRVLDVVKIDGLVKHRIFNIKDFYIKSEYNDI
ncbi:MAG: hypothetical protein HOH73_01155, partial [Alphaproteobacteria bacterium]|nr:hypothetical protein [Alphaproteobacteria bacterium]